MHPRHNGAAGPTTAMAVSCRRLLISLHHSLLMLPTGPGSAPLAVREIDRQLWSWNSRTSTYAWAKRARAEGH